MGVLILGHQSVLMFVLRQMANFTLVSKFTKMGHKKVSIKDGAITCTSSMTTVGQIFMLI